MKIAGKDVSHNDKTKMEYIRTVYQCEKCDAWGNTEVPITTGFESGK